MAVKKKMAKKKEVEKSRMPLYLIVDVCAVLLVILVMTLGISFGKHSAEFSAKSDALYLAMQADPASLPIDEGSDVLVFLSKGDGKSEARVAFGHGETFDIAFEMAKKKVSGFWSMIFQSTKYLKGDVVLFANQISPDDFIDMQENMFGGGTRLGISADTSFKDVALDSQINAGFGPRNLSSDFIVFQTAGWLVDENNTVIALNQDTADYGTRIFEDSDITPEALDVQINEALNYLLSHKRGFGEFADLYYTVNNTVGTDFDINTNLAELFFAIKSANYEDGAKKAIAEECIEWLKDQIIVRDELVSFVSDTYDISANSGSAGLALACIYEYMDCLGEGDEEIEKEMENLSTSLANGLLALQDETGHIPSYFVPDQAMLHLEDGDSPENDGEICYGLLCHYMTWGGEKYLDAAKKTCEYMLQDDYCMSVVPVEDDEGNLTEETETVDTDAVVNPWLIYSLEMLAHIEPEEDWYQVIADKSYDSECAEYADGSELMGMAAGYRICKAAKEKGIDVSIDLDEFRMALLEKYRRNMNFCFLPEYAMYVRSPETVKGSFYNLSSDGFVVSPYKTAVNMAAISELKDALFA